MSPLQHALHIHPNNTPSGQHVRAAHVSAQSAGREFFIDNQLVWTHFIAEMVERTGLAP